MVFNRKIFFSFLWIVVELTIIQPQFLCAKNASEIPDEPYISYFGGSYEDVITVCATLKNGNKVIAGHTSSDDLPVTPNCHQSKFNYGGIGTTGFLACFDTAGALVWCTYFGKDGYTRIYSGLVDGAGNFVIVGETSADSLGTINGISHLGSKWSFLAKFSPQGEQLLFTYLDGRVSSLAKDEKDTYYLAGGYNIFELKKFGFHDSVTTKGAQDIFFTIVGNDGKVFKNIPIVGNKTDEHPKLTNVVGANLYLSFRTNSDTIFGLKPINHFYGGDADVFLLKLDTSGFIYWGQYLGSKDRDYQSGSLATDHGVLISLLTFDSSRIVPKTAPISYFSEINRSLLAHFSSDGNLNWATYTPNTTINFYNNKLDKDSAGLIYQIGSVNEFGYLNYGDTSIKHNAFQKQYGGGESDMALYVYEPNGKLLYGTFIGGNGKELAWGFLINGRKVFISGNGVSSDTNFTTANAFQKRNNGLEDGIIASFELPIFNPDIYYNTLLYENSNCKGTGSNIIKGSQPEGGNGIYTYSWLEANSIAGPYTVVSQQGKDFNLTNPINSKWYKRVVNSGTKIDTSNAIVVSIGIKGTIGFIINKAIQCLNQNSFEFEDTTFNANGHLWDFGDGTFSTERKVVKSYDFNVNNQYQISLINSFGNNCFDTLLKPIFVIGNPSSPQVFGSVQAKRLTISKYTYSTNKGNRIGALVQNGKLEIANDTIKVSWQKSGLDTLKVWAINAADCISDTTTFPIDVEKALETTAIENLSNAIEVYPNPAKNQLNILNKSHITASVEFYNSLWQNVLEAKELASFNSIEIDVSSLTQGTYIVKISSLENNYSIYKKVIIVN